ncbi:MAG TPA: outer membrane beta-barrel protein, partial [Chitinophagaceae bacterium]|nr:outer membrane beta-barrel protein [Chitinophagaceae bacterium]
MKKFLVLAFALFAAKHSSAQVFIAPELGVQMVKMNEKTENTNGFGYVPAPGYKSAFRAGMNFAIDIKSISIHAGLFYTGRGYRISFMGDLVKANLDYIDIPVYVNYNIINKKGNKLFVGAGPYISYCLGGRLKLSSPYMSPSGTDKYYLSVGSDATY